MIHPSVIYHSGVLSLVIQVFTGLFDLYVVFLETPPYMRILKHVLWLEIIVQVIEGTFYVWLVRNFHKIGNITKFRYWDWIITTPTMLISFTIYLYYLKTREETPNTVITKSITDILYDNADIYLPIMVLNTLMLAFGYLAEIGKISHRLGAVLGFVPFVAYFYIIYETFAKYTDFGRQIFWVFAGIWALYGVASVMTYTNKNVMYNILDLFAKNFFGIFIAGLLFIERRNE
jgi:hypothetical protein